MLDLILIIMLIVSLFKPEVLLSKKMKEKANEEQKIVLTNNLRKQYFVVVGLLESASLIRYFETIGIILAIVFIVLFFKVALPAIKETSEITKELNQ